MILSKKKFFTYVIANDAQNLLSNSSSNLTLAPVCLTLGTN